MNHERCELGRELLTHDRLDARPLRHVLELCAGTGALSLVAAGVPGTDVTAVDVSRRALLSAWTNARRLGRRLRLHRGDLVAPVVGKQYDLVVSNPPYVPTADASLPTRGAMRAFDGGLDGRTVVDRVIDEAPRVLAPGGCLLLVHSAINGVDTTLDRLAGHGLEAEVAARCEHPFGPVFTARAAMLEQRGLIEPGQRTEELVVIRARRPLAAAPSRGRRQRRYAARPPAPAPSSRRPWSACRGR